MIARPTHVLTSTRSGSRSAVPWMNHPRYVRKGEPSRRSTCASARARKGEPGAKTPSPLRAVLDASPLLVILHYLLKNNRTFMDWNEQGQVSPQHPSVTTSHGGASE